MRKIRNWLKRAETARRSIVTVEEKDEAQRRVVAADTRHGILPMVGRRVA